MTFADAADPVRSIMMPLGDQAGSTWRCRKWQHHLRHAL